MLYRIEHRTVLPYGNPVWEHQVELRLTPRQDEFQRLQSVDISIAPDAPLRSYRDSFGNLVHCASLLDPHEELEVGLTATVETQLENPFAFDPIAPDREEDWLRDYLQQDPSLWDYVFHRNSAAAIAHDLAGAEIELPSKAAHVGVLDAVQGAVQWITDNFEYRTGVTHVHSTLADVLNARAGVCQDFAHLLSLIVRSWGFPARYVMGYQDAEGAVATAPHAWVEVLIPGAGWRGFDATNGLVTDQSYVAVNVGRDYLDAAPVRGSFKGDDEGQVPRVTLAMTQSQQTQSQ